MTAAFTIVFFLFSVACGWQGGNTLIRLRNGTPLRWIDKATPAAFAAVHVLVFIAREALKP